MNGKQILFVVGVALIIILLLITSVIYIHGSWPNLTSMTAIPDCAKEIVGNCIVK